MRGSARLFMVLLLLPLPAMVYLACTSYFAQYNFVAATRQAQSEAEHEGYLRRALRFDASYGYANFALARVSVRRGYYGAALPCQEEGMRSFNSLGGFRQLGTIRDRLGQSELARSCYEGILRMHPNDIETLERLAKLALEAGEHERVAELTARILYLDMVNTNALYLRARDAELVSNWNAAYQNYQQIATVLSRQPVTTERVFYDPKEVQARMADIGKLLARK